jgi:hypothetical protein
MDSDGRVDERILIGEPKRRRVRVGSDIAVTYAYDDLDFGFERALDDDFTVSVELVSFDMCV